MKLTAYLELDQSNALRLSRKAGVAHTTIRRLVTGQTLPRRRTLAKIAAATAGMVSEQEILSEVIEASRREAPPETVDSEQEHPPAAGHES